MKKFNQIMFMVVISFLAILFLNGTMLAQEPISEPDPDVEIPFIDRDGDGINDLLQNGWGLRFRERYKKRQLIWEQLNVEIIRGEDGLMVDTDGDGIGDMAFSDFMKEKMNEIIDTDGDGIPDTSIRDYLGSRFKAFDRDGDGLPDDFDREEFRELLEQMRQWRQEVRDRMHQGLPPFIDEDGDGIPDGLPDGFYWRGRDRDN